MKSLPVTSESYGEPTSKKDAVLLGTSSITHDFKPIKNVCAHLNAFHAYADDLSRSVETNHFCSQINSDVRQCLLYDSPDANARLIGVEYMITPRLYESLPPDERRLWHSHVYEVKSGMLVMPNRVIPQTPWDMAENKEMEEIVKLYGKTYHLWQTDRGDKLPLGEPRLMTSYISDGQLDFKKVEDRDRRFGTDYREKRDARQGIPTPDIHKDADSYWKD